MKKLIALFLALVMAVSLVACGSEQQSPAKSEEAAASQDSDAGKNENTSGKKTVLNIWSFTDEVAKMVDRYLELNPDFAAKYEPKYTIISTTDGAYEPALDQALVGGGADAPDIYCAEAAFVLKYTQGDASQYAAPYEDLGIDVATSVKEADIAQYSVDIGTRNDGKLVALGYQATGGAFLYRRSVAMDAFGTDEPAEIAKIIGGGSGNWDKFFEAAQQLKEKGYSICSTQGDLWHAVENSSGAGWLIDGELNIDPARENFLDLAKSLYDNDYYNEGSEWSEGWFADMKDEGPRKVFGYFGPAWLINYTIAPNCGGAAVGEGTYGDWAICEPPVGFFWGGTWLLANKDTDNADAVAELINWITLDCTENGLQYMWANGTLNGEGGTKDCVASGKVMAMSDGKLDFLNGQDMFDVFVPANKYANGKCLTQYDQTINKYWNDQVALYSTGEKTREEAIAGFKQSVADNLDVIVNFD